MPTPKGRLTLQVTSEGSAYPNRVSSIPGPCAVLDAPCPPTTDPSAGVDPDAALHVAVADFERRITAARALNEATRQSGHSWALTAEPGVLARIVCWSSRRRWLTAVASALATREGEALCRRQIRPIVVLAVARAMARFADSKTGRSVTASAGTIAARAAELLGRASLSSRTVFTARRILSQLGYAVEVARGRYLTSEERLAAAEHHGGVQDRAASTWALTSPRPVAKEIFHLPSCSSLSENLSGRSGSPKRARAYARRAQAPSGRKSSPRQHRSLAAQRVTADLLRHSRGLDRGAHLGTIIDVVASSVDCERWTGRDLAHVLYLDARKRSVPWPDTITNPAGFLRHRLAQLGPVLAAPSPSELERLHADRIRHEQEQRRAQLRDADNRRASSSHVAEVMAQLRDQLRRTRTAR